MRKVTSIIGMIIALVTIVYSFFAMGDEGQFFGIKMNIWMYRLIWAALFVLMLNSYLRESKKSK